MSYLYSKLGYEVLENALSIETVDALLNRLDYYESNPELFERELEFQYDTKNGEKKVKKMRGLHLVDPEYWSPLWKNDRIQAFLKNNFKEEIKVAFCAAFMKPKGIGTRIPYHQDQALWAKEYPNAVSCWYALDEATSENGCLIFSEGSHLEGLLTHEQAPDLDHLEVKKEILDKYPRKEIPLKPGNAVVWDRFLIHGSNVNQSSKPRRGVVVVFAPGHLLSSKHPIAWTPS